MDTYTPEIEAVYQGWMLKKRRKKLQGFARRYFTLHADGVLSYSAQPDTSPRDHLILRLATISSSERRREFHIDSGVSTFHCKCLSSEDHTAWMRAFKKFMNLKEAIPNDLSDNEDSLSAQTRRPEYPRHSMASTIAPSMAPNSNAKLLLVANDMERAIKEMEKTVAELSEEANAKRRRSTASHVKPKKEHKEKEGKEGGSMFGLFHRKPSNHALNAPAATSSGVDSNPGVDEGGSQGPTLNPSDSQIDHLSQSLTSLRTSHTLLTSLLSPPPVPMSNPAHLTINTRMEEDSLLPYHTPGASPILHSSRSDDGRFSSTRRSSLRRVSLASMGSAGEIFYDASEDFGGAEFFSMDDGPENDESQDMSRITEEADGESTADTQDREDNGDKISMVESSKSALLRPPLPTQVSSASSVTLAPSPPLATAVRRRTQLPAPTSGDEVSLFTVLKRNVGKDLSTVSFPVSFNEPLSLLQHLAEDLEYTDVIEKAVAADDPIERMSYVAAFAVSGYACTKLRASRKPFNPMLGETFEDARFKFISEKVSHHPPIMACHAEGEGWEFWASSGGKNKFWGKSLELIPVGTTYLRIGDEIYSWQKPSSWMRNLIAGEKYLEHCGALNIACRSASTGESTGIECVLDFKEGGFWGTTRDQVAGTIASSSETAQLQGLWHQAFSRLLDTKGEHLHVLWRAAPLPPNAKQYYGFTQFAVGLNEITEDLSEDGALCPSDSRGRPDQRALEDGRVEDADELKVKVEEAQRERRRERERVGAEWVPRWFSKVEGQEDEWVYKGGYWEAREKRDWSMVEKLW